MVRTSDPPPLAGVILNPGTSVCTLLVKDHQAMLHNEFQAAEPSDSGEEDFKYISCLNPRPYVAGPFWIPEPPSEQICLRSTRLCHILNIKHLSQLVLKKKIFYFSIYFYDSNVGPPDSEAILEPGALI